MVYSKKHRHSKKCRHSTKKHRHSKKCRHSRMMKKGGKKSRKMYGGEALAPAPFSLGGSDDTYITNFESKPSNYSSNTVPTSNINAHNNTGIMQGTGMQGGKRRRMSRHKKYRGGIGYGFLPQGSDLTAKTSSMANVAPYQLYNEI